MNTFGKNFRVTTFGESHGIAIGAIIDGCPAGINLTIEDIQQELNRRRPGQSILTTQRQETDQAEILSGVFNNQTLGTPIAVIVRNKDQQSRDYDNIKDVFRPGHADEAWQNKFGFRDYRGGGRSSGRETIGRVIGGAIARKIIPHTQIIGHAIQIHNISAINFDASVIEKNNVRCADSVQAEKMANAIMEARKNQDSLGGIVEIIINNCPIGIGEPVFAKLSSKLAEAILSIGAVRSFELYPGKQISQMTGFEANKINSGISGGISNGEKIVLQFAVKPTPSIAKPQLMKSITGDIVETGITGRHDPCLIPRIIPVAESMVAMVLADLFIIGH